MWLPSMRWGRTVLPGTSFSPDTSGTPLEPNVNVWNPQPSPSWIPSRRLLTTFFSFSSQLCTGKRADDFTAQHVHGTKGFSARLVGNRWRDKRPVLQRVWGTCDDVVEFTCSARGSMHDIWQWLPPSLSLPARPSLIVSSPPVTGSIKLIQRSFVNVISVIVEEGCETRVCIRRRPAYSPHNPYSVQPHNTEQVPNFDVSLCYFGGTTTFM